VSTTEGTEPGTSIATIRPSSSAIGATAEAGTSSPGAMTVRTLVSAGSAVSAERYFSPTSARLTSATTRSSALTA